MLVNVKVVVERMDGPGKSEFLFSVPDNLLERRMIDPQEMRTIGGQLLEGFVWSYKDLLGGGKKLGTGEKEWGNG